MREAGRIRQRKYPRPMSSEAKRTVDCAAAFAGRLVAARENLRWSQADLAKAAGLQAAVISHFERGRRLPSLPNAVRLADALRVSIDWLTGRDNGAGPAEAPHVVVDGVRYLPATPSQSLKT